MWSTAARYCPILVLLLDISAKELRLQIWQKRCFKLLDNLSNVFCLVVMNAMNMMVTRQFPLSGINKVQSILFNSSVCSAGFIV